MLTPIEADAENETIEMVSVASNDIPATGMNVYQATFKKEGYDNLKNWWETLQSDRAKLGENARAIADEFFDYLEENEIAQLKSLASEAESASTFEELNYYSNSVKELKAIAQERYDEAMEELAAQQATQTVVYSSSTGTSSSVHANNIAQASTWSGDASSAKAWIINHESGGSYTATNGRYYGAYQLDISYLGGDLSPENQDRVAEEYVNNRYGGWDGAMSFWQSNGWY